ncbi:MAG: hypothetical protein EOP51_30260, partial [Sphingobacteriales bacterium]
GTYSYLVKGCDRFGACTAATESNAVSLAAPGGTTVNPLGSTASKTYTVSWSGLSTANQYKLLENGVQVYNGGGTSYGATVPASGTYSYQVQACNIIGCGPVSTAVIMAVSSGERFLVMPTPSLDGKFTLVWNTDATNAEVWVKDEQGEAINTNSQITSGSAAITKTTSGTYRYSLWERDRRPGGNLINTANVLVVVDLVFIPQIGSINTIGVENPIGQTDANGSYTLEWGGVVNAQTYQIERSSSTGTYLYSTTTTTYSDATLPNGEYRYRVRGCRDSGMSCGVYSSPVTVIVKHTDIPVTAPLSVNATLDQMTGITRLSWAGVIYVTTYEIQTKVNAVDVGVKRVVEANSAEMDKITVIGTYSYAVRACIQDGTTNNCSAWTISNAVSPEVPPAPIVESPLFNDTGSYKVAWNSIVGALTYELYENDIKIQSDARIEKLFILWERKVTGGYRYQVRACKSVCGPLSNVSFTNVTIPTG